MMALAILGGEWLGFGTGNKILAFIISHFSFGISHLFDICHFSIKIAP
jgi:hypothetical protein